MPDARAALPDKRRGEAIVGILALTKSACRPKASPKRQQHTGTMLPGLVGVSLCLQQKADNLQVPVLSYNCQRGGASFS